MPWDSDLDVQVSESALYFLAEHYNMTQHEFRLDDGTTRRFLLEINPNFVLRTKADVDNVIDARWIDMSSGLFIDITSVRKDYEARAKGDSGALMCKDWHRYQVPTGSTQISFVIHHTLLLVLTIIFSHSSGG